MANSPSFILFVLSFSNEQISNAEMGNHQKKPTKHQNDQTFI